MTGMKRPIRRLIISYSYAPVLNPRAFRWQAIAEHWAARGDHVDVICAWKPGLAPSEVRGGVHVHRVAFSAMERIRARLGKSDLPLPEPPTGAPPPGARGPARMLRPLVKWVHDQIWTRVYWPDAACLWHFPARGRALGLLRRHVYTTVISVSPVFTAHTVGYGAKLRHPGAAWLMDIGDPFCFLQEEPANNLRLYGRLNCWYERRAFRRADAISVTTESTRQRYTALFPESGHKIRVIPPLLPAVLAPLGPAPPDVFAVPEEGATAVAAPEAQIASAPKTRLVFVGRLYRHIRRPDNLLRLFAALIAADPGQRLELHFVGDVDDCRDSFAPYHHLLGRRVFLHGTVSRERAYHAMAQADILVNLGNVTPYQLPSKVVEYAATGKPVLHLAVSAEDSSLAFFRSYPPALCLVGEKFGPEDERVVRRFLNQLPQPLGAEAVAARLAPFRLEGIVAAYADLFRLVNRPDG